MLHITQTRIPFLATAMVQIQTTIVDTSLPAVAMVKRQSNQRDSKLEKPTLHLKMTLSGKLTNTHTRQKVEENPIFE